MASIYDELFRQGAVPAGTQPKSISSDGTVTAFQPNKLNRMAAVIGQVLQVEMAKEKQRQEKLAKQFDMYKVLRDAGYDSKSAHEAVQKNQLPDEAGGETLEQQKQRADIGLTQAKTDYYKQGGPGQIERMTPNQLQQRLRFLTESGEADEETQAEINTITSRLRQLSTQSGGGGGFEPDKPAGKIKVKRLSDGQTGQIDASKFDPKKYQKI